MAKISFNFGANARKPKKTSKGKSGSAKKGSRGGSKGNAWRAYTRGSNAPIPD